jgi:hypothetical protein
VSISWLEFARTQPQLAAAGKELLYQYGVGLAYISTVRPDGGPRLHPICPVVSDFGLHALLVPSPKMNDLKRDPRFALHSFATPENEDAFYLTGKVEVPEGASLRSAVEQVFRSERESQNGRAWDLSLQTLIELRLDSCLLTRTTGHGDPAPQHVVWKA